MTDPVQYHQELQLIRAENAILRAELRACARLLLSLAPNAQLDGLAPEQWLDRQCLIEIEQMLLDFDHTHPGIAQAIRLIRGGTGAPPDPQKS